MNKRIALLALAVTLTTTVVAQPVTTRQECLRRCHDGKFESPLRPLFEQTMARIEAEKRAETDDAKRKALDAQAERETNKYEARRDKVCRANCDGNPEQ